MRSDRASDELACGGTEELGHNHASWPLASVDRRRRWRPPFPVRLTDQRFTCAAKARVPKPTRRTACLHVSRPMRAARRRSGFDFARRLGRRAEAGPRRVLPRVRRRRLFAKLLPHAVSETPRENSGKFTISFTV